MQSGDRVKASDRASSTRKIAIIAAVIAIIALALVISRSGWFELRPASGSAAAMAEAADKPVPPAR
jgi:hypothetical protein